MCLKIVDVIVEDELTKWRVFRDTVYMSELEVKTAE